MMTILILPYCSCTARAATEMLLKKQKPMCMVGSAW